MRERVRCADGIEYQEVLLWDVCLSFVSKIVQVLWKGEETCVERGWTSIAIARNVMEGWEGRMA